MTTQTKNIYEALAKFQEKYEPPKKDKQVDYSTKKGGRTKYSYADHQSVTDTIRKTGAPLGLSYSTSFVKEFAEVSGYNGKEEKKMFVTAIVTIGHSSGESLKIEGIPMSPNSYTPQEMGSARTYAERYALSSAFGISTTDDDDGNMASQPNEKPRNNVENMQNKKDEQEAPTLGEIKELQMQVLNIDGVTKEWLDKEIIKRGMFETVEETILGSPNVVNQFLKSLIEKYEQKQQQKQQNTYAWGQ